MELPPRRFFDDGPRPGDLVKQRTERDAEKRDEQQPGGGALLPPALATHELIRRDAAREFIVRVPMLAHARGGSTPLVTVELPVFRKWNDRT